MAGGAVSFPPRCDHGHIILGCPEEVCEKQDAYLADMEASLERWHERQRHDAREIVELLMGEK